MKNIKEQIYNIYYNYNKDKLMNHNIINKIVEGYIKYQWILIKCLNKL